MNTAAKHTHDATIPNGKSTGSKPKLLVVSLIPDTGHVTPLIHLAERFQQLGMHCISFFPSDCFVEHDFEICCQWEARSPPHVKLLNCHASLPRPLQLPNIWMVNIYLAACYKRAQPFLPKLKMAIAAADLVLVDGHIFGPYVSTISSQIGTPVVISESSSLNVLSAASLRNHFGLAHDGTCALLAEEITHPRDYKRLLEVRQMRRTWKSEIRQISEVLGFLGGSFSSAKKKRKEVPELMFNPDHIVLSIGLGAMVTTKLIEKKGYPPLRFLPPLPRLPKGTVADPLKREVLSWMESTRSRTALVCFGTQANAPACRRVLRACLRALHACSYACVLITKLAFHSDYRTFVVERLNGLFEVMQAADLVVNHGGAGMVIESLLLGKPMLCVPFAYDQFTNALFVSRILLAGERVPAWASATAIRKALCNVDENGCYANAQKQRDELLSAGRVSFYELVSSTSLYDKPFFQCLSRGL
jgi:hypothetical protein